MSLPEYTYVERLCPTLIFTLSSHPKWDTLQPMPLKVTNIQPAAKEPAQHQNRSHSAIRQLPRATDFGASGCQTVLGHPWVLH